MLQGIAASQGIGIGTLMLLEEKDLVYNRDRQVEAQAELERLKQAVEAFCTSTARQAELLRLSAGEEDAGILEFHMGMAQDPELRARVVEKVRQGSCAEDALQDACDEFIQEFSCSSDELTRLRAADIRDVCSAVLRLLLGVEAADLRNVPKNTVLAARELNPSIMAGIDRERIVGIITETGGLTSHSSILARAMGIPAVCGVAGATQKLVEGSLVIVDGSRGEIIRAPEESLAEKYRQRRAEFLLRQKSIEYFRGRRTLSADGREFGLYCNISMPSGAARALEAGGEGVGLFRTEYLFMNREESPGEEEQFAAYSQTLKGAGGLPVIIRTLDVGGDKEAGCLDLKEEENPFLGLRGIRWCLAHPELFYTQLRALLRAGAQGDLRLLLPMVTTLEELREAKALVKQAEAELAAQGLAHGRDLPLGVMIETPAAAAIADRLAREADFFSIGTNDLTGYIMACDRGNQEVAGLYSPLQPAVLRCLKHVVSSGERQGIPVCVCGEAAGDPDMIPLLMAFGVSSLSVSAAAVLQVREEIAGWSREAAEQLAAEVLELWTEEEITRHISAQREVRRELAKRSPENGLPRK